MLKKLFIGSILSIVVFSYSFLHADEAKQLFIKNCLNCHRSGGKADPVNPADKAGRVWKKYFKRGRHPETDKLVSVIGNNNLQSIIDYLVDNAADSDHPEAAVIPK